MAQTKKKTGSTGKKASQTRKAPASKNTKPTPQKTKKTTGAAGRSVPYILAVLAVLIAVCVILGEGWFGEAVKDALTGIFAGAAFALPVVLLLRAILWKRDSEEGLLTSRTVCLVIVFVLVTMLLHVVGGGDSSYSVSAHYGNGKELVGGGVVGGLLGQLLYASIGKTGSLIIIIASLVLLSLYVAGVTPRGVFIFIAYKLRFAKEERDERRAAKEEQRQNHPTKSQIREEEYLEYLREKRRKQKEADPTGEDTAYNPEPVGLNTNEPEVYRIKKRGRLEKKKEQPDKSAEEHIKNSLGEMMSEEFSEDLPKQVTIDEQPVFESEELTQDEIDERLYDEVMRRTRERLEQNKLDDGATDSVAATETLDAIGVAMQRINGTAPESDETDSAVIAEQSEDFNVADLFVNPEDAELIDQLAKAYAPKLDVQRETVQKPKNTPTPPVKPAAREYKFPPIEILTEDPGVVDGGVKEELQENARKLTETLKSFNVKTQIQNISRGPTITRYELLPEPGTRVRSIVNLVDDIALNLATTGVRIEAPIPGKSAVGIEVPNKKRATVHLRTLIEDAEFSDAKGKLTVCLGQNVGGENVYFDIAKMPHMLIAGATGSGKSVCINSIITSILYKASPEDVKMILIDPKKVELNIYNGIPHLLVPVVSEPKKAAGSLSWAVSEMERRFGLIEAVGVRDIKGYNQAVENDPDYEYLPRIVIVIDELADLMMTAPDDVEESICRIAQKARAAGMHLIIGTQRPSVDVITGLIKANIPSRIAFRTSSQIDSRTIIDIGSAANLIGMGDMLFNPVGAMKPTRVQGAFVSESDVEEVVSYIKNMNAGAESYSDEIANQIEREAQRCGVKKGSSADIAEDGDAGDEDPMLKNAIELAIESGKISTSLIQRRLSLGYGRAAKLIDRMEQLGYVSAPDGQKPREVLITKQQYMEMRLKDETPFE